MIDQICRAESVLGGEGHLSYGGVETAWAVRARLGEGPAWIAREAALWFVDIKSGRLHRFDDATGVGRTFDIGGNPSFVVPADDGALLVGSGNAVHRFGGAGLDGIVATVAMPARNRTNDATVDNAGRLWFGTMDDDEREPTGAVHRFDARSGEIMLAGGACTITNGPAIGADGRSLYHVDTLGGTILRFDLDESGRLESGTRFATIDPADGKPDGVTLDAEACLWVGLWGGWRLRRYAPDGTILGHVELPCANVTKVAFGGPDLQTGYVTTAAIGLSEAERAAQPGAGDLFRFRAPAPGLPLPPVAMRG